MKIVIGSDHAGFHLKQSLLAWLLDNGYDVDDIGTYTDERTDYPRYGAKVGRAVAAGQADRGVAVCGSGEGICMAANKVPGVRGGVIRDSADAEMTRRHNNANVACFGERFTEPDAAIVALKVFLETDFDGGRHADRVAQLDLLDQTHGEAEL
jgi:ribose 5-phosphate isomerase B